MAVGVVFPPGRNPEVVSTGGKWSRNGHVEVVTAFGVAELERLQQKDLEFLISQGNKGVV